VFKDSKVLIGGLLILYIYDYGWAIVPLANQFDDYFLEVISGCSV
jgi:hypothetical protein